MFYDVMSCYVNWAWKRTVSLSYYVEIGTMSISIPNLVCINDASIPKIPLAVLSSALRWLGVLELNDFSLQFYESFHILLGLPNDSSKSLSNDSTALRETGPGPFPFGWRHSHREVFVSLCTKWRPSQNWHVEIDFGIEILCRFDNFLTEKSMSNRHR